MNEVLSAAKRLREQTNNYNYQYRNIQMGADQATIAAAALAEGKYLEDDGEAVTEEWLRSQGWKEWREENGEFDLWTDANPELGWKCRLAWLHNGLYLVRMADDNAENYDGPSESVEMLNSRNKTKKITRVQLRSLLAALGIVKGAE